MAAGVLAKPGAKYGPCKTTCKHRDCAATKRMAQAACSVCGKPIGFDVRFYQGDDGLSHAACDEDALTQNAPGR